MSLFVLELSDEGVAVWCLGAPGLYHIAGIEGDAGGKFAIFGHVAHLGHSRYAWHEGVVVGVEFVLVEAVLNGVALDGLGGEVAHLGTDVAMSLS